MGSIELFNGTFDSQSVTEECSERLQQDFSHGSLEHCSGGGDVKTFSVKPPSTIIFSATGIVGNIRR